MKLGRNKLVFGLTVLASSCALAAPSAYMPSSTLTTGPVSHGYAMSSLAFNPASAQLLLRGDEKVRIGWLSTIGAGTEFGDVSNFEEEINALSDELDRDNLTLSEADDIVDRFNGVLPTLGDDGYIKLSSGAALPLMPSVFTMDAVPGNFFIDVSSELLIGGRFIDAPVEVQVVGSTGTVTTQSSLYLKSGEDLRIGMGYAQPVWAGGHGWQGGELIVGGRLDYHRLSLSKQVISIQETDDIGDTVTDDYDNNQFTTNGASLSLGALWRSDHYQLGLTVNNINEPEFEYGTVGTNCSSLSGPSQNNCFQAQAFAAAGRLDSTEVHTMHAYMNVDASYWVTPNFMLGASFDLGEHEDFVGDDHQWLSITSFIQPQGWVIPGFRVGYRQNQVGSELSSLTLGTTLFQVAKFDLLYGLENTEVDGNSAPRSFAFNIGFEERF